VNLPESTVALLNELFNAIPEEKRYVIDVETGEYYLDENGEKMANFNGGSFLLDEEGIPYYPGVNAAGTIDLTQEYALFLLFRSKKPCREKERHLCFSHPRRPCALR
jgi:hypothetical protein